MSTARAQSMLSRVHGMLAEYRSTSKIHKSERDPSYLNLMMMEQALTARLAEDPVVAAVANPTDPKTKQTVAKAVKGQQLNPDEQKTITGMAMANKKITDPGTKATIAKAAKGQMLRPEEQLAVRAAAVQQESRRLRRKLKESDLQQAQVVMATQDMVDQIQKMMEQISSMQFKDLPALTDAIKNDMGPEQATQFQQQAAGALTNLLASIQEGKTQLEQAQGALTGQGPVVPGQPGADMPGAMPPPEGDADISADLDIDADIPDDQEEIGGDIELGRTRR